MSGPSLEQIRQQQNAQATADANRYASQNSSQRAAAGMSNAGASLGRLLAKSLGGVNPEEAQAEKRQAELNQQIEIYNRDCVK
jgi:hypothetical protein